MLNRQRHVSRSAMYFVYFFFSFFFFVGVERVENATGRSLHCELLVTFIPLVIKKKKKQGEDGVKLDKHVCFF